MGGAPNFPVNAWPGTPNLKMARHETGKWLYPA
jgi:hypothetical protein